MISITVEKDDAGPFLQVMTERASDFTAPISQVLESALGDAQSAVSGGGPDFGWASLSPWTPKVDVALGRSRTGLLRESGALAGSLARGGAGNVFSASAAEGEAGTSLPHARFQQEGTDRTFFVLQYLLSRGQVREWGGKGIPPRPFLYWHEERFTEYDRIFADHLMGEG